MRQLPIALTIAGSDSGGGAGIQADLKTFASLKVHGASVLACLTAQNPKAVLAASPVAPEFVRLQLEAVFSELRPGAVKTGMLFSAEIIETARAYFEGLAKPPPIVIDPVMVATSGAMLLKKDAVESMKRLFSLAALITPNLDEAEALLARKLRDPEDLRRAARDLREQFGCAVLAKGGHLPGLTDAIDFYFDGRTELMLSAPFIKGVATHGTGCTYSAAITAFLARGFALPESVRRAKQYISLAIARSTRVGRNQALGWF